MPWPRVLEIETAAIVVATSLDVSFRPSVVGVFAVRAGDRACAHGGQERALFGLVVEETSTSWASRVPVARSSARPP
jgi:hypothetical protein